MGGQALKYPKRQKFAAFKAPLIRRPRGGGKKRRKAQRKKGAKNPSPFVLFNHRLKLDKKGLNVYNKLDNYALMKIKGRKKQKEEQMNVNFKKKLKIFSALIIAITIVLSTAAFTGTSPIAKVEAPVTVAQAESLYGGYYDGLDETLMGTAFRSELAQLITTTHKYQTSYDELRNVFPKSDADPNVSGNILWFYTGTSVRFTGSFNDGTNREHVWPKQNGQAFPASSQAGSDAHHLRPTNANLNSTRGNNSFDEVAKTNGNIVAENGSTSYGNLCYQAGGLFYPGEGYRGATARILMYLQTRWGDDFNLTFVDSAGQSKTIGKISTLMKWHLQEPPTAAEIARNDAVYKIQGNRNPFIDHPEYATKIYCNDGKSYNAALNKVVETYGDYTSTPPESITLSQQSATLAEGETLTLSATVMPKDASQSLVWSSSNGAVATVSNGVITAKKGGTCTITAASAVDKTVTATLTLTVKGLSKLTVSGTPVKTEYTAGDKFDPKGLTVTATYTDGATKVLANTALSWVDGVTGKETLSQGTTSVLCKIASLSARYEGIKVTASKTVSTTIYRSSFTSSGGYAWHQFSTAEGLKGYGFIYPGNSDSIQINISKTSHYFYNTTPVEGGIVSITVKMYSGERPFTVRTSTTPYTQMSNYPTTGTSYGEKTATTEGTTWVLNTTDQYFTVNYTLTGSSGAAYIESITVTFANPDAGDDVPGGDNPGGDVEDPITPPTPDLDGAEAFIAKVDGLSSLTGTSLYTAINEALSLYNALSEDGKEVAFDAYVRLILEAERYNAFADELNGKHLDATNAMVAGMSILTAALGALAVIIKQKLF